MIFVEYNPNPKGIITGDCVIRAICKALNKDWEKVYMELTVEGLQEAMWGDTNHVWERYLREHGFTKQILPNTCPDCYTIADFAKDFNTGTFIIATGSHVVTIQNGNYYDTWDSGYLIPSYFFYLKEESK